MAKRGYLVYALDVRGLGSWQAMQGQEDVDFDLALSDIGAVINVIAERHNRIFSILAGSFDGGGKSEPCRA